MRGSRPWYASLHGDLGRPADPPRRSPLGHPLCGGAGAGSEPEHRQPAGGAADQGLQRHVARGPQRSLRAHLGGAPRAPAGGGGGVGDPLPGAPARSARRSAGGHGAPQHSGRSGVGGARPAPHRIPGGASGHRATPGRREPGGEPRPARGGRGSTGDALDPARAAGPAHRPHRLSALGHRGVPLPPRRPAGAARGRRSGGPRQPRGLPRDSLAALARATGRVRFQSPSPLGVEAAVAGGVGVGMLPVYLGRRAGLLALGSGPVVHRDVFLVIHRAMSRLRRIRAVCTFVEQALAAM